MKQNKKIRVVWICHLSNSRIRKKLQFDKWKPKALITRLLGRNRAFDFASWNTKAIKEFEKFEDIELHIVAPHYHISGIQEFNINGINYHFFESEDDNLLHLLKSRILTNNKYTYNRNSKLIIKLINNIKPDLIHMIGAENPYYGKSALLLPPNIPFIVALQTLMSDSEFLNNYPISLEAYNYRANLEKEILKRADYISCRSDKFINIIYNQIDPKAKFLDMPLAVGENINLSKSEKLYDFVYFAADIAKAVDYALEAFAIVKKKYPNITLHIVGGYSNSLMLNLKNLMTELELGDEVSFTGKLPTHDDVINEIRKARFAILPLKIDQISGTIREGMANGIPVVTTITPATPKLNEKRESILLSEKSDFNSMANNMCQLLSDEKFANQIRQNAIQTIKERYDNTSIMNLWRDNYHMVIANTKTNK